MVKSTIIRLALFIVALSSNGVSATGLTSAQALKVLSLPSERPSSGQFIQKKYFKVLSKPFVSEGEFKQTEHAFEWQTLKPVVSGIKFDGDVLWQSNANGVIEQLPVKGHFVTVVKALVGADLNLLANYFDFKQLDDKPCIILSPKDEQFSLIASSVSICYQNNQMQIKLEENNGNYTEISLSHPVKKVQEKR